MEKSSFSGAARITDEGIKKHFKSYDPAKVLFELVWNGLDAGANTIAISIKRNDLGGLEGVSVFDDGEGIDVKSYDDNFGKFNESSKKLDDDKHGSHGRGRLSFHKLSDTATWFTRRDDYDALITINGNSIKKFAGAYIKESEQHDKVKNVTSGTCVVLSGFTDSLNLPSDQKLTELLSREFSWYLALNPKRKILLNNHKINVPDHEVHKKIFDVDEFQFSVKVIRWDKKPSSEKSYNYFVNSQYKVIQKELSKFNNKVTFHTSAYVFSEWVDQYNPEILHIDPQYASTVKIYKSVKSALSKFQRDLYNDFLRKHVDKEIDRFIEDGYFPTYNGVDEHYADWRLNNTKDTVREIYIADPTIFNKLKAKQAKILIRLLDRLLISSENDSVFEVLDGVLDLDSEHMEKLAGQLQQTTIENIISTISTLQKREIAVFKLRELMDKRFAEVLETPDLQHIIENNTWLFGPQYSTLGAEEESFTTIAKNLRDQVNNIEIVSDDDIAKGTDLDGVNRQVDLFLARKMPTFSSLGESYYKCVIVEIKRPGISLNKKHLQQLDDYAEIIAKHPAFTSTKMTFELILIGRKISRDDYAIKQRFENLKDKGVTGLVSTGRISCFVKDWFSIFDEFELSNKYLLETLDSKLKSLSNKPTEELVEELQA
ncbi:ATP-binding protein [Desulfogranum japonicum]|uniref:ATP-binding protein n=1 Tax=Desulfogranum japonicum TaxID=231447 RepID=UPI00041B56D0|nr:ATP-binding protein [Desulfogranum japonicum]